MARQSENPLWNNFVEKRRTILIERAKLFRAIKNNPQMIEAVKIRASRDVLFFSDMVCVTFDPRHIDTPSKGIYPFVLFERQREVLEWLGDCQDKTQEKSITATIVKSRDTGMSWVLCLILVHSLIFKENFNGIIASRKACLVDQSGNPSTLFSKIEMLIKWLPDWIRPPIYRKFMFLKNELNGSIITGESGTDIGRGARASLCIIDEGAFVPNMETTMAALSATTKLVIALSTPNGKDYFYKLATNPYNERFDFRWSDDPRKDQKWRDDETNRLGETLSTQEYDCSFDASRSDQFIPTPWIAACIDAHKHIKGMDECLTDTSIEWQMGLDLASEGGDKTVLTLRKGVIVTDIWEWTKLDTVQSTHKAHQIALEYGVKASGVNVLCFDKDGIGDGAYGTFKGIDTSYSVLPFNGGGSCSENYLEDFDDYANNICLNARAEAWLNLKIRIRKTYEVVTGRENHPIDELISLPDHSALLTDLTKPEGQRSATGKLKLMSKVEMKKKGLSSPDFGDSLAYTFWSDTAIYRPVDW